MNDILKNRLKNLLLSGIVKTADMCIEQTIMENISYQKFRPGK